MTTSTKEIPAFQTYCNSLTQYSRFKTREVKVGNVGIGGNNPIRIQSMTVVDTMDTEGSVEQAIRMIESGCEMVRITAPGKNQAYNLENIKRELRSRGYDTPLIADIHFKPKAAEIAARIVEKVRVNPGNYADKKKFKQFEISDDQYEEELERIRERFAPLVKICKEEGTAMRIGTNHGSLSDRIMNRYGDTPLGMVESAMEFLRICEEHDFHDIVLSMKASNTQVMVQAYRLLVKMMKDEGMNYPLHLGVTEAGEGEEGRTKSSVGIGTLLEDGLGDTIRVSLTEEPEVESPVAQKLADRYINRQGHPPIPNIERYPIDAFDHSRRSSREVLNFGGEKVPCVIADISHHTDFRPASFAGFGYFYSVPNDKWNMNDLAADYVYVGKGKIDFEIPGTLGIIQEGEAWQEDGVKKERHYPLLSYSQYLEGNIRSNELNLIGIKLKQLTDDLLKEIQKDATAVLVLSTDNPHGMPEQRRAFVELMNNGVDVPAIIHRTYTGLEEEYFKLYAATDFGGLLIDGLGDGVWFSASDICGQQYINNTAFGILQASRVRISKTEYISCPSCGRTLFDLQETTAAIRERTNHLKGVKIGIMGCIVNGPGEMADADYGYVGAAPGKITLYKGHQVVKKNIPSAEAVDALIELIDEHGDWVEPN